MDGIQGTFFFFLNKAEDLLMPGRTARFLEVLTLFLNPSRAPETRSAELRVACAACAPV